MQAPGPLQPIAEQPASPAAAARETAAVTALVRGLCDRPDDLYAVLVEALVASGLVDAAVVTVGGAPGEDPACRVAEAAGPVGNAIPLPVPPEACHCAAVRKAAAPLRLDRVGRVPFLSGARSRDGESRRPIGDVVLVPVGGEGVQQGVLWAIVFGDGARIDAGDAWALRRLADYAAASSPLARRLAESQRASRTVRDREDRQAFLLQLGDALRPLADPADVKATASRMLRQRLGAERVVYSEMLDDDTAVVAGGDYSDDTTRPTGTVRLADYGATLARDLRRGRSLCRCDIMSDPELTDAEKANHARIRSGAWAIAPLVKEGRLVAYLVAHFAAAHEWTEDEVALLEAVAEQTWAAAERARAERALHRSEHLYRSLFEAMDEGYALCELVRDDAGEPIDYRFLEVNPGWTVQTGVPGEAVLEKRRGEVFEANDEALEPLAAAVETAEPRRFELFAPSIDRWFDVGAFPRDGDRFALLLYDITERKRREANVAFLAELEREFAGLSSAEEIVEAVGARLGEHLDIDTCNFCEVRDAQEEIAVTWSWRRPGAADLTRTFSMSDFYDDAFKRASRNGETVVIEDTGADPRVDAEAYRALGVGAFVSIPFLQGDLWTNSLTVTASSARPWRRDELELFQELAGRVFPRVERARSEEALRESRTRLQRALEIETVGVLFFDLEGNFLDANETFLRMAGTSREALERGELRSSSVTVPEFMPRTMEAFEELEAVGRLSPYEKELVRPDGTRWWGLFAGARLRDDEAVEFVIDVTDRKEAERALRDSEHRYRSLFEQMDEGFALCELVRDGDGRPVDYRFLEVNPAWSVHTGLSADGVAGRLRNDVFPTPDDTALRMLAQVIETGQPTRFEMYSPSVDRWYDVGAFPRRGDVFAVLFYDITDRKRKEAHQAFLAETTEEFSRCATVAEIIACAGERLANHVGVERCIFFEIDEPRRAVAITHEWHAEGVRDLADGRALSIADFVSEDLFAGQQGAESVVVHDTAADPRFDTANTDALGIRSAVIAPIIKNGAWQFVLAASEASPRIWRDDEAELVRELAERMWLRVERARVEEALQQRETQLRQALDAARMAYWTWDVEDDRIAGSHSLPDIAGLHPGETWESSARGFVIVHPDDRERYRRIVEEGGRQLSGWHTEFRIVRPRDGRIAWLEERADVAQDPATGKPWITGLVWDVTERREAETALRESEERMTFLLRLSDALRRTHDAESVYRQGSRLLGEYLGADRVTYGEIIGSEVIVRRGWTRGVPPLPTRLRVRTLGDNLLGTVRGGGVVGVRDAEDDARLSESERELCRQLGVRAFASTAIAKDGRRLGTFSVHSASPRDWTHEELQVVREVAERLWSAAERAKTQQALRKSETKYRSLFESIDEGFYMAEAVVDDNGACLDVFFLEENPAAVGLFGTAMKGRFLSDVGDWDNAVRDLLAYVARTGKARRMDAYFPSNDMWLDLYVFRPAEAGPNRFAILCKNITWRKRSEEALMESEERFRAVVDLVPDLLWRADPAGNFVWCNRRWVEATGRTLLDSLNDGWHDLVHPADREATLRAYRAAMVSGRPFRHESRLRRADGEYRWYLHMAVPVRDDAGHITEWFATSTDVHQERTAMERLEQRVRERTQSLAESEERYRALVTTSAQILWTADAHGRVVEDSPTWRAFTGQTVEQWRDEGWTAMIYPEDRPAAAARWLRSIQRKTPLAAEFRLWHEASGTWRWVQARGIPLHGEDDEAHGWFGTFTDIHERKQAAEKLQEMARRLTMAEQEERRRISQILHDDLQQLLHAVDMKLDMVQRGVRRGADGAAAADRLAETRMWIRRAVETTRQLTVDLSPQILRSEGLAAAISWLASQMRELHGMDVEIEADRDWQIRDEDMRVLLFQTVRELLFNVKKHSGTHWAGVRLVNEDGRLVIHVHDEGSGFDTASAEPSASDGRGWGLARARERLNLLGGRLRIDSEPGKGTHVTVYAPPHAIQ